MTPYTNPSSAARQTDSLHRLGRLFLLIGGLELLGAFLALTAICALPDLSLVFFVIFLTLLLSGLVLLVMGMLWRLKASGMLITRPPAGPTAGPPSGIAAGPSASDDWPPDTPVTHEIDGVTITVRYRPPVRRNKSTVPSELTIRTGNMPHGVEWEVVREGAFDRFAKQIGLAVEVQSGDAEFDDQCFVRSDQPRFTSEYLTDPLKRLAILDLLGMGFCRVAMHRGELIATWTGFEPALHGRPDLIESAGARLVLLARGLPEVLDEEDQGRRRRRALRVLWPSLILYGLSFVTLAIWSPLRLDELVWTALPVAGTVLVGFIGAGYLLLSGTSRSHSAGIPLLIAALFLVPLGSLGLTQAVNVLADAEPAAPHRALVLRKYTSRSKNTTHYHVVYRSWREGEDDLSLSVDGATYSRVREGQSHLLVTTRPGALNIEWIVDWKLEP